MKKKINILLLAAVLSLWGTVIYKFVKGFFGAGQQVIVEHKTLSVNTSIRAKDTFRLESLGRDPFLNKPTVAVVAASPTKRVRRAATAAKTEFVNFPDVQYFGYIKGSDRKNELILLKINGQLLKMSKGEKQNGLKIVKLLKDSLVVSFNGVKRSIKKG